MTLKVEGVWSLERVVLVGGGVVLGGVVLGKGCCP